MLLGVMGCSIGGVGRHIVTTLATTGRDESFPWGTLLVNVAGCGLMGAVMDMAIEQPGLGYLLLGFCGGFTTFSAFSLQNLGLLSEGRRVALVVYVLLSVGLGLTALLLCGNWMDG